jgi:hypothetical protein
MKSWPSGKRSATRCAACTASAVLPMPPRPSRAEMTSVPEACAAAATSSASSAVPAGERAGVRRELARRVRVRRQAVSAGSPRDDGLVQLAQFGARLEPQFVEQRFLILVVHGAASSRLPGAVEREHQLAAERLVPRVLLGQRAQLVEQFVVAAEVQLRLDPALQRLQVRLLQFADPQVVGERGDVGQRSAAPEPERRAEVPGCLGPRLLRQLPASRPRTPRRTRAGRVRPVRRGSDSRAARRGRGPRRRAPAAAA